MQGDKLKLFIAYSVVSLLVHLFLTSHKASLVPKEKSQFKLSLFPPSTLSLSLFLSTLQAPCMNLEKFSLL